MHSAINDIIHFWFGDAVGAAAIGEAQAKLWWGKDDRTDREIAERFADVVDQAAAGKLTDWASTPQGMLALVLCTDQFPRNIYRNTPQSFAYDAHARQFAEQCIARGLMQQLAPIHQVFIYLPYEHSEALADQQHSVTGYYTLAANAAADEKKLFDNYLKFAQQHYDIIARFGRFPHRNAILGRESTEMEKKFLTEPGSSF